MLHLGPSQQWEYASALPGREQSQGWGWLQEADPVRKKLQLFNYLKRGLVLPLMAKSHAIAEARGICASKEFMTGISGLSYRKDVTQL